MARKLEDLRLLNAVVQLGSFTQAAAHTGTTQSRVSRAVARLERDLGVTLVHRTSRRVAPTDAGRAYAKLAQRMLADLAQTEAALREDLPNTKLSISSPPAVGRRLLARPIAEFCRAHPQVTLDWSLGARRVDLIAEDIDLTVRFAPLPDTWRRARSLLRGAYHIVAAPSVAQHADLSGGLAELPTLSLHVTHLRDRWPLIRDGAVAWMPVTPRIWADDVDALIELASAGAGVTMLPDFLIAQELALGQLVRLTTPAQATPAEVFAVTEPQGTTKLADALASHLIERLRPHRS